MVLESLVDINSISDYDITIQLPVICTCSYNKAIEPKAIFNTYSVHKMH